MTKKKILMLSMSCNQPYFQALLGAVKDTWAKPVIQGKYDNITWFGYTSCDDKHPTPCVDFNEHMIYTATGDNLWDTYYKTREAYNLIKNVIDFDYIVRTNTSTFVNIENMLRRIDEVDDNSICASYTYHVSNLEPEGFWILIGYFFMCNKKHFEYMLDGEPEHYHLGYTVDNNDDVILSKNINKYYPTVDVFPWDSIQSNGHIPVYKGFPDGMEIPKLYRDVSNYIFVSDPNIINESVMVRVRPLYETDRTEMNEIKHFYELNDILKNGR